MHVETTYWYLWNDSKCTLSWSTGTTLEKLSRFIRNCVTEMRTAKNIQLNFMHGTDNPAEIATREAAPTKLNAYSHWWKNPSWLQLEQNGWSDIPLPTDDDDVHREIESECNQTVKVLTMQTYNDDLTVTFHVDPSRFSDRNTIPQLDNITKRFEICALNLQVAKHILIQQAWATVRKKNRILKRIKTISWNVTEDSLEVIFCIPRNALFFYRSIRN